MQEYVYDAFISYSHRDMQWAKRLQHRLETFPIPKDMTDAASGRRKLRVFRDQTDLTGSELEIALRKELDASKFDHFAALAESLNGKIYFDKLLIEARRS